MLIGVDCGDLQLSSPSEPCHSVHEHDECYFDNQQPGALHLGRVVGQSWKSILRGSGLVISRATRTLTTIASKATLLGTPGLTANGPQNDIRLLLSDLI